jgi:hypothetical protein
MQDLQVAAIRWRKTLLSLKVRYRRPYTARHSSVSWNLMLGKNVLWVAKQHGHSIITMLRISAAWTEGAVEADVQAIARAMKLTPSQAPLSRPIAPCGYGRRRSVSKDETLRALDGLAVDLPVANGADDLVRPVSTTAVPSAGSLTRWWTGENETGERLAGAEGFELRWRDQKRNQ